MPRIGTTVAGMVTKKPPDHWLTVLLCRAGKSQAALARHLGVRKARITELVKGQSQPRSTEIEPMSVFLNVKTSVIIAKISGRPLRPGKVPLVGVLGAGGALSLSAQPAMGGGLTEVDAPPFGEEGDLVAAEVQGDAMLQAYRNGDLIYYNRAAPFNESECLDVECIVRLATGEHLVAILARGGSAGLYTLIRHNAAPIVNASVEWATPIIWVQKARGPARPEG